MPNFSKFLLPLVARVSCATIKGLDASLRRGLFRYAVPGVKMTEPRLSKEDQARVDKYLESGGRQQERTEFRPWRLLLVIWCVMLVLSGASYWIASSHGVL